MSPSKILFFLCISFVVGIFFESIFSAQGGPASGWKISQSLVWAFLFLGITLICISVIYKKVSFVIGFCILFMVIGILRVQISEFNIANDKLSKFNGTGEVTFIGTISNEPDVRDTAQMIKVRVGDSTVLVTTKRYPEYKYLDQVKLTGKLETPAEIETFSYKNYLMKNGIYSVMGFPKVELVSQHDVGLAPRSLGEVGSYLYEKILFCKQKIRQSIQHNFLPPQSLILQGTILGDNGAMSADLKSKLNITGLRHVIAVSGTHVVILCAIIMSLLLTVGLWRRQAFYIALVFILIYIVLTGLPPSGVRAGIMGGAYLLSQQVGRQATGSRIIVIACAIMLLVNPLLLVYDVGFQLSFLAVLGLIYLEPLFKMFMKNSIVSTTFAAQVFTLPIMIYNFGNISFVSPITNLLVLPIVPEFMVFGFLASVAGIFFNFVGWILSVPCWLLLTYFVKIIDYFSQPWMGATLANVSWIWIFISYFIIVLATRFFTKKYRQDFL